MNEKILIDSGIFDILIIIQPDINIERDLDILYSLPSTLAMTATFKEDSCSCEGILRGPI